ncbi:MAG: NUDIX hydrolase [Planctomycetes bacterium]|nr:NUDIX hydrolase [Planctomycetota bacterium]
MELMIQAGAIPYRPRGDDGWEYLLITSQKGNWIFPKGIVEPGELPEETAVKECREEAGVRGRLLPTPVGSYLDHKWNRDCRVVMYLLEFAETVEPWEERLVRDRRWFRYEEAKRHIKKRELRGLLKEARARLRQDHPARDA